MTDDETEQAIQTLTRDLAKLLVISRLSHRVNTPINDRIMREIEIECSAYLDELRRRNDMFADLPRLCVSFDRATMSLALRWAGELQ